MTPPPPGAEPAYDLNALPLPPEETESPLHLVQTKSAWKDHLSSGPATDDSGHEIQATRFLEILFSEEDQEIVDYTDTDGNPIQVPHYMVRIAEAVDEAAKQGRHIVERGEGSNALKLFNHTKKSSNVDVIQMQILGEGDARFESMTHVTLDEEGKPKSIFAPGGASITAVNPYLKEHYGPQYTVEFGITALSQLAANIATSGAGGNRKKVPATKLWVKDETKGIRIVTDPKEIASYFGSQGYAGDIMGMELEVSEVPPHEECVVITFTHQSTRAAYQEGAAQLLAAIYEYNLLRKGAKGIHVSQIEIMDRSGTQASERTANGTLDLVRKFNQDYLQGRALSVMLKIRHTFDNGLEKGYSEDDPEAEHFLGQLMELMEKGVIEDIRFLLKDDKSSAEITMLEGVREGMTHDARHEGNHIVAQGGGSTSEDGEIRFHIDVDPNDPKAIEATRINVLKAVQAVLEIHMDEHEEILALNDPDALQEWFHTIYGHLSMLGIDLHDRKAGPIAAKIKTVSAHTHQRLMELDGRKFGNVTLEWTRGEKEKPNDESGIRKSLERDREAQINKFKTIQRGGDTFGFRIQEATKKVATEVGITL